MSNELLAAFGITDEDLKEAKEEKKISSARTEKKKAKKKKIFVGFWYRLAAHDPFIVC